MERGTRIVGQYQSEIHQGQSRIPTLAVTAWTPNGVPVPLNSPIADGLGRVGMDGEVHNHYLQRFGGSVLLLLTQGALGAAQAALQRGNNNTYLQMGGGFDSVATEALRNSINIPPTITKNPGEDAAFFITTPVDFSAAYELHVAR
jgi:type IV secretion system protein VirB10